MAAAVVTLAAAGGVGFRFAHNARSAPPPPVDDHPNLPVVSDQERRLLAAIELYPLPPKTLDKIRQAAGYHVELGVLYWEQRRHADAERLFDDMSKRPNMPPVYRAVGSLGLAVTYALRDDVDRSNRTFLDIKNVASGYKAILPQGALPLEDAANLRHWVVTALDRNATRPPLPKELEDMRKELRRWRPNAGGPAKPG